VRIGERQGKRTQNQKKGGFGEKGLGQVILTVRNTPQDTILASDPSWGKEGLQQGLRRGKLKKVRANQRGRSSMGKSRIDGMTETTRKQGKKAGKEKRKELGVGLRPEQTQLGRRFVGRPFLIESKERNAPSAPKLRGVRRPQGFQSPERRPKRKRGNGEGHAPGNRGNPNQDNSYYRSGEEYQRGDDK